eukprot:TRINITY_DN8259_c0_g1_i1.p1 TRINITY_DN8259_c0_g1~~TRINITY_DN8259_c0_g1_i1.p1  ORF type:complete len:296 (+),score=121.35 TRINITY_DN8259_c0_g1_i1:74-961(+)
MKRGSMFAKGKDVATVNPRASTFVTSGTLTSSPTASGSISLNSSGNLEPAPIAIFEETPSLFSASAVLPPTPPENAVYRPAWLMHIIRETINKGAFLTPRLYISKDIWYQYDVVIEGLDIKPFACEVVCELVKSIGTKIPKQDEEEQVVADLEAICMELDTLYDRMAQRLPNLPQLNREPRRQIIMNASKNIKKAMQKNQKKKTVFTTAAEKYVNAQLYTFDNYRYQLEAMLGQSSRTVENWLRWTDRMKLAKEFSRFINSFIEQAILTWVFGDITKLYTHHVEKLSKGFYLLEE